MEVAVANLDILHARCGERGPGHAIDYENEVGID